MIHLKPRINYSIATVVTFLIGIGISFSLIFGQGTAAFDIYTNTGIAICIFSFPIVLGRFFISASSYVGRLFDFLMGGERTLWHSIKEKKFWLKHVNNELWRSEYSKWENKLTPLGLLIGLAFAIALIAESVRIPFMSGLGDFAAVLFISSVASITTGSCARTGRAHDCWQEKNNEVLAIIGGLILGISCVIAGLASVGLSGMSMFGASSAAIGLLSLPLIIGNTISGTSYIGRMLDPFLNNQSIWHGICILLKINPPAKIQETIVLRGRLEIIGIRIGVALGIICGITLAFLVNIPTFGLPIWVAGALFVLGTIGGVAGCFARLFRLFDKNVFTGVSVNTDTEALIPPPVGMGNKVAGSAPPSRDNTPTGADKPVYASFGDTSLPLNPAKPEKAGPDTLTSLSTCAVQISYPLKVAQFKDQTDNNELIWQQARSKFLESPSTFLEHSMNAAALPKMGKAAAAA